MVTVFTALKKKIILMCKNNRVRLSFSLVELAVVLSVAGVIIGGGLMSYKATNPILKSDLKKMQAIEDALQQFFTINGRLPYPAYPGFDGENMNYLTEYNLDVYNASGEVQYCDENQSGNAGGKFPTCSSGDISSCCPDNFVLWGIVPTRTLGLSDEYAYDGKGHNFEYITHAVLTYPNGREFSTGHKKSSYMTDQNGKYVAYFTHSDKDSIKVPIEMLSIYSNRTDSELLITKNNTAYVLISKGNIQKCYFDAKNGNIDTSKPTGKLLKNCVQNYLGVATTDRTIYQGYSKDFDNLVRYKTLSELIQKTSNIKEDIRILTNRNNATEYQLKVDSRLTTESKEVSGAINELSGSVSQFNSMFKTVSTFNDVTGDPLTLYFLTTAYDNYSVGIYLYEDGSFIPLNGKKNICEHSYPIGSIYITTDETMISSAKLNDKLGCGKWERMECGAILQNAGQSSNCGTVGEYSVKGFNNIGWFKYRDLPVNYTFQPGLPDVKGETGCILGDPCRDQSSCNIFKNGGSFEANKECGRHVMFGQGSGIETYNFSFSASGSNLVFGNAQNTVQPFTYTVYMWKRIE